VTRHIGEAGFPGPVFFRQERIGKYGRKPFRIIKFRSMVEAESVTARS
jgi:lipopolysaccharide/colanic/teichoic acid biosynthesis glycosyltransferase